MANVMLRLAGKISSWLPGPLRRWVYRLGPLTRLIRRTLNRAAPQGLTRVQVAAGVLKGCEFRLDLHAEKDLWLGTYEAQLLDQLTSLISPGMIVYDVGANLGYLTVAFARLVGRQGAVHAFEPLPANVTRLRHSVLANDLSARVTVVESAVADKSGQATFLVHPSGGMGKLEGSQGRDARYTQKLETSAVTLDDYVARADNASPQWIKLDVEGGEGAVLRGATGLLHSGRPSWLIEIHGPAAAAEVWQQLVEAGYLFYSVAKPRRQVMSLAELDWKAYLLALPQERAEAAGDG